MDHHKMYNMRGGLHWKRLEKSQDIQEALCWMEQRRQGSSPEDALKSARELATQVQRDRGEAPGYQLYRLCC